ncbi:DUF1853 family protein [Polaribacter tangerinus]|uniref:DUF1853 family protein n=1 Tax=Polaribacter tangerinus TaxID=1920034 RepID=UPI000B4B8365|nr:DUF1853 family protein [Polaribacter tangerinus]
MHNNANIQLQYIGYLKTPCLWKGDAVGGLTQFEIETHQTKFTFNINEKLRLGKYIERFVSHQISQNKNCTIIAENVQLQDQKRTIGELDCLLSQHNTPIHLEIIYKFYLYDKNAGTDEIDQFIGPNKKDSLSEKIDKLSSKQLPVIKTLPAKDFLKSIKIPLETIKQQVYFKAQLFTPLFSKKPILKKINSHCIVGFYCGMDDLQHFTECKFYIPTKKNWLISPHTNVNWLSTDQFKTTVKTYLENNFSPMCWLKHKNGNLQKFFLVWW